MGKALWLKVKENRNYTVDDIARTLGVHKGTVRRWIKDGLPCVDDQRPFLIQGKVLKAFLQARQPAKQKCAPHECYCLKCRKPRPAAFDEAEFTPDKAHSGMLRALCATCTTVMHKRVSYDQFRALETKLTITFRQVEETLTDS